MDKAIRVKAWAKFLSQIRKFFDERGFYEVSTPALVTAGAFESCLDSLQVSYSDGRGELNTSPEIEMKALLAETSLPIYQLAKSYRDDPPSPIHFKEFTMLEFYKPGADYFVTQLITKELFSALAGTVLEFNEISVKQLAYRTLGLDLEKLTTTETLRAEVERRNIIALSADDTWDDIFFKLLIEKLEPALPTDRPTLLKDYPPSQAALAALDPLTGWADRFEIYWKGVELCNGCTELADLSELRRRFDRESELRRKAGKAPHPFPEKLFSAVERMPNQVSGVAVGLDRLFQVLGH